MLIASTKQPTELLQYRHTAQQLSLPVGMQQKKKQKTAVRNSFSPSFLTTPASRKHDTVCTLKQQQDHSLQYQDTRPELISATTAQEPIPPT